MNGKPQNWETNHSSAPTARLNGACVNDISSLPTHNSVPGMRPRAIQTETQVALVWLALQYSKSDQLLAFS
jgi:hypothetical protein